MSATDIFETVLVTDKIIGDITDKLDFAVESGGATSTYQQFNSTSASSSNIVFSLQLPSESVVFDRHPLIQSTINFALNIGSATTPAGLAAGSIAFDYGLTDALQSYPLSKLILTYGITINNCNVNINLQDVIDPLLRMNDSRELFKKNSTCPAYPDQIWGRYSDAVLTNSNPMAGLNTTSYDIDQIPRGAYPLDSCVVTHHIAGGGVDGSVVSTNVADWWVINCSVTVTEPIFVSPFLWGNSKFNTGGIVGVNTLNIVANIDQGCKRFWSTASSATNYTASITSFTNTKLLLHFLNIQPSMKISTRVCTPFYDVPRFLTSTNTTFAPGATQVISSQSIQLNNIPKRFYIFARVAMASQTIKNTASFFPITNISLNFNNSSGLLASATKQDLWRISVESGLCMSWQEWNGLANVNSNATGTGSNVQTIGSILVISPPKDLSLPDYLTSGSRGQFQLQFNLTITNNTQITYGTAGNGIPIEVVLISEQQGVFITELGSSATSLGILTDNQVLSAKEKHDVPPYTTSMYNAMVGGSMLDSCAGAMKGHRFMMRKVHRELGRMRASGTSGGGGSGGGGSGGGNSGGSEFSVGHSGFRRAPTKIESYL